MVLTASNEVCLFTASNVGSRPRVGHRTLSKLLLVHNVADQDRVHLDDRVIKTHIAGFLLRNWHPLLIQDLAVINHLGLLHFVELVECLLVNLLDHIRAELNQFLVTILLLWCLDGYSNHLCSRVLLGRKAPRDPRSTSYWCALSIDLIFAESVCDCSLGQLFMILPRLFRGRLSELHHEVWGCDGLPLVDSVSLFTRLVSRISLHENLCCCTTLVDLGRHQRVQANLESCVILLSLAPYVLYFDLAAMRTRTLVQRSLLDWHHGSFTRYHQIILSSQEIFVEPTFLRLHELVTSLRLLMWVWHQRVSLDRRGLEGIGNWASNTDCLLVLRGIKVLAFVLLSYVNVLILMPLLCRSIC